MAKDWKKKAEAAGMTRGERNMLERPIPGRAWKVPGHVRLVGGSEPALEWKWTDPGQKAGVGEWSDERRVLENFIDLAIAPDDLFVAFAERYGPLLLCQHRLPITHSGRPAVDFAFDAVFGVNEALYDWDMGRIWFPDMHPQPGACYLLKREPLSVWRATARRVKAIIAIAGDIHRGKTGREEDWRVLDPEGEMAEWLFESLASVGPVGDAQMRLAAHIRHLENLGDVRSRFSWPVDGKPRVVQESVGVFGVVARQVALAVGRSEGYALCYRCGIAFVPSRKPRSDQRSWCPDCKAAGEDVKQAKRDAWERKRKQRRG